jgi:RNA polymerase sigma-70 factor, ECF subfamily
MAAMQEASTTRVGAEQELAWVFRARQGDQEAFARLVEAYQVPVYNLAYRMLGVPTEAEDAAQETFIRAYTRLDTFDPARKFSSWILSIASHHCVDRLRRRGNVVSMEDVSARQWLPDEHPKPEEQALGREQSRIIHTILERLPAQYRLVIILRYWHDLSYEEIAEMTHTTESAVKSRLHRAREMMSGLLTGQEPAAPLSNQNERRVKAHALSGSF